MRWGMAVIALAGCDKLFDIDLVEPPPADALMIDAGDAMPDASFPCPGSYLVFPSTPPTSRYRWVGNNVSWDVAEADCEGHSSFPNTHLVVFDGTAELPAIRDALNGMFGQFAAHAGYARSLPDADPFQFYAVTGEALPLTGFPWNTNEPTGVVGAGEETTVRFETFADLTDQPWDTPVSYLCECDQRPVRRRSRSIRVDSRHERTRRARRETAS